MSYSPLWETPFFEDRHRALAERLLAWDIPHVDHDTQDFEAPARALLASMAEQDLLELVVPREGQAFDLRSICLAREIIGYRSGGLADSVFIMQGIGTGALALSGAHDTPALASARSGRTIAAFALTEPVAGSDVANITTTALHNGVEWVLNGDKTFITNAGIADHYIIVARTGEAPGSRGLSAFLVDAGTPGLVTEQQRYVAAHPGGNLTLTDCRVPTDRLIGAPGGGFKLAMQTFDIFRASVGAAAIGFARRALDEAVERTASREMFGKPMNAIEGVQSKLAEMATAVEGAALLVYRAAWAKDISGGRCTREVSMAKMVATEAAQQVIDDAVQLFGGLGVTHGSVVERLYREVRPMRIYEGASEVQKLIIGRDIAASAGEPK